MAEIKTTKLYSSWLWKQGRTTGIWVRRYYVLIRREQVDEIMSATSDVVHELCCFDSDAEMAECISSLQLEGVVSFDHGADAGLPQHIKDANETARKVAKQNRKGLDQHARQKHNKRTVWTGFRELIPLRLDTDELADYSLQLKLPDRVLRLRAETRSAFDGWRSLFESRITDDRAQAQFEGWVWFRQDNNWLQQYSIVYQGVMFFFNSIEECDMFKHIAGRSDDGMFVATPLATCMLSLEHVDVVQHSIWGDRNWVIIFQVNDPTVDDSEEKLEVWLSVVDEAQSNAWALAVRNVRHWFETIGEDHPTRRLFGGLGGGDDDGQMIEQHANPIAMQKLMAAEEAEAKAAEAALLQADLDPEEQARKLAKLRKSHARSDSPSAAALFGNLMGGSSSPRRQRQSSSSSKSKRQSSTSSTSSSSLSRQSSPQLRMLSKPMVSASESHLLRKQSSITAAASASDSKSSVSDAFERMSSTGKSAAGRTVSVHT